MKTLRLKELNSIFNRINDVYEAISQHYFLTKLASKAINMQYLELYRSENPKNPKTFMIERSSIKNDYVSIMNKNFSAAELLDILEEI